MNEFYHSFVAGFNSWYIVAPAMIVAMVLLGMTSFRLDLKTLEMDRTDNERLTKIMSAFMSLLLFVLIIVESGRGIIQWLINHMDNAAYLIFVIPVSLLVAFSAFAYILYLAATIGGWARLGYLVLIREDLLEKREKAKKAKKSCMVTLEKEPVNKTNFCDIGREVTLIS